MSQVSRADPGPSLDEGLSLSYGPSLFSRSIPQIVGPSLDQGLYLSHGLSLANGLSLFLRSIPIKVIVPVIILPLTFVRAT